MGAKGGVVCGWGRDGPLAEAKTRGVEEGFLAREPTSGGCVLAKRQADGGERDALGARGGGGGGGVGGPPSGPGEGTKRPADMRSKCACGSRDARVGGGRRRGVRRGKSRHPSRVV